MIKIFDCIFMVTWAIYSLIGLFLEFSREVRLIASIAILLYLIFKISQTISIRIRSIKIRDKDE